MQKVKAIFINVVWILGLLSTIATIGGYFGKYWWFLDNFSHFRVQYFGLLILLVVILFLVKKPWKAIMFTVFGLINLYAFLPYYLEKQTQVITSSGLLKVLLLNVDIENNQYNKVIKYLKSEDPDVLLLLEVNSRWSSELKEVIANYSYSIKEVREDNFGIALCSKYPFDGSAVVSIGEANLPSIYATIRIDEKRLNILGTHPLPPVSKKFFMFRNEQLLRITDFVKGINGRILLLGDLNVTPWNDYFKKIIEDTELSDSSRGGGPVATWPVKIPPLSIPIDHLLYSDGIVFVKRKTGPNVGSDHYPVTVELFLKPLTKLNVGM